MTKEYGGIILSPGCHNSCTFCDPVTASSLTLSIQEKKAVQNLNSILDKGIKKLEISGCDPIESPTLLPLIKYAKTKGIDHIEISTHAMDFSDKLVLKKAIDAGLDKIRVPLYGKEAVTHEAVTQSKGSFEKSLEGIKNALVAGIQVQISCLITKQNKDTLKETIDFIQSLNPTDHYVSIPCLEVRKADYYIPIKDLPKIVTPLLDLKTRFMEIPFCVFNKTSTNIDNSVKPPDLGEHNQPKLKSAEKDLPSYRIKIKPEMCKECKASKICDGFFKNDFDKFGSGDLKPIK